MRSFLDRFRIVSRAKDGKHHMSPLKELEIDIDVAHHLGTIRNLLDIDSINKENIGNANETQF